jgi:ABC-type phosphate transport system substrate-binding protein
MSRTNSLRLALAAVGSLTAIAVVAPGAQASYFDTTYNSVCKAAGDIHGLGASTQRNVFLNGWGATLLAPDPGGPNAVGFGYDAGADYATCQVYQTPGDGGTKTLDYRPTGSGSALDVVGGKTSTDPRNYLDSGTGLTISDVAFASTDDPPTDTQIADAEKLSAQHSAEGNLLTIPVAQVAIGTMVRLPDGCQVADQAVRQISRSQVNLAFEGVSSKWSDIFGTNIKASSGSPLTDADCQNKVFARVVRKDSSGSTFVFKRYLYQASHASGGDNFDWRDPTEGGTLANNAWPAGATSVIPGDANGAGALLDKLSDQSVDGGIGYADVGTARGRDYGWTTSGGAYVANDTKLWLRSQRLVNTGYNSPAKVNDEAATGSNAGAACENVTYSNEPTSDLGASWFSVTANQTSVDFPVCALTYQLTWLWGFDTEAARYKTVQSGATEAEVRGYRDFIRYAVGIIKPGVGPSKLAPLGYSKLPSDVAATAKCQAKQVGWLRASSDPQPTDPIPRDPGGTDPDC